MDDNVEVETTLHPTVCREGILQKPICEGPNYKCQFCSKVGGYAYVVAHMQTHEKSAVKHGGHQSPKHDYRNLQPERVVRRSGHKITFLGVLKEYNIYACNLQCRGERHFHCPYCPKTIVARKQFESHMDKCVATQSSTAAAICIQPAAPPGTPGQYAILLLNLPPPLQQTVTMKQHAAPPDPSVKTKCTLDQFPAPPHGPVEPTATIGRFAAPNVHRTTPVVHLGTLTGNTVKSAAQIFRTARRKIKCPMCNLYLNKKNLRKHKLRKHLISEMDVTAKDHLRSQCIDSYNGVYAVAKSYKATAVPVHVIKKRSDSTHIMCGEHQCEVIADFRRRSGLTSSQCPHLRSVDFCFTHAGVEDLKPGVLEELVANKLIGKDTRAKCLNLCDQATQNKAPVVALVDLGGSNCLYLSVFESNVSPHSKLGRIFVTYNVKRKLWHCDCSRGRINCLHKCVAKWYLFQTNKELFSSDAKQDTSLSISEFTEEWPAESSGIVSGEEALKQMAKYIYNQKKMPSVFPEEVTQLDPETHFSKRLIPVETVCHDCTGHVSLTEPVLITNKAKVITVTGVMEGLSSDHTDDGGAVEKLERTGVGADVLQAYLHFEALTSHDCQPSVMMDLYQKGIFSIEGIKIKDLTEVNAGEFWDSVCMEVISSSLDAHNNLKDVLAETKRLSKQRTEECHRAVTRYLVKGLNPLSTLDSPWFREMTKTLNPKYQLPSRDQLINTLIPSWYSVERKNLIAELLQVSKAAVTCDAWTSLAHNHFLTVTLHFIIKDQMRQKVLCTKSLNDAQTGAAAAEHISDILKEFGVKDKVVAMTVENTPLMDFSIKKLPFRKLRCFTHILSLAAQMVFTSSSVTTWASKIRAVVVWINYTAGTVLQEKQQLWNLPQHSLIVDVPTCWISLYLMVERMVEQYAAIQATTADPLIKLSVEKKRLETLSDADLQKAEEFIRTMKPLYTSSLCVSADKSPTCSQIFPILSKLEAHFKTQDEDSLFTATLKEKVWGDLSTCYKDGNTWQFLQEASAMDPRFKNKVDSDKIWDGVKNAAVGVTTTEGQVKHGLQELQELQEKDGDADHQNDKNLDETPLPKKLRLADLEELSKEEDGALRNDAAAEMTLSILKRVQREIQTH
ncbi:hypothetical protein PAMP_018254 [Pampus punctatissimus]